MSSVDSTRLPRNPAPQTNENSPQEKLVILCACGKKYRVSAKRAGSSITCRLCSRDVHVPRHPAVSTRTRAAVLGELGIDTLSAESTYRNERAESTRRRRVTRKPKVYRCTDCGTDLDDPSASYGPEGMVCEDCRAAEVCHRPGEEDPEKARSTLETYVTEKPETSKLAMVKASAYGALFFVGIGGMIRLALGASGILTGWLLPLAAGGAGAWLVYQQNR